MHSVALCSDGSVVAWGDQRFSQCNAPALPAGLDYVEAVIGGDATVARRSDGSVVAWGTDYPVPAVAGCVQLAAGSFHVLARRADGSLVGWGDDSYGQASVPALPPGATYVSVAAGTFHSVAVRSDGVVVAWGSNGYGQCNVPAMPYGLACVDVAAGAEYCLARRSDGSVVGWGRNDNGQCNVPGAVYVAVAGAVTHSVGRLADGSLVAWGDNSHGEGAVAVPQGLTCIGALAGGDFNERYTVLRHSDGSLDTCGDGNFGQRLVPSPPPGFAFLGMSPGRDRIVAVVGRCGSYVRSGNGCVGSRGYSRLVPRDTPRIGVPFQVGITGLSVDAAFLITGWSTTWSRFGPLPLSLGQFGMPGCTAYVSDDDVAFVRGSGGQAQHALAVPGLPGLLGLHFHQQAIVLDPGTANALGAVWSDAATGVVGS